MYRNKYDKEFRDETRFFKKNLWWIVGFFVVVGIVGWTMTRSSRAIDSAFIHYEEFQEIYNTCAKLNVDLCNMKELAETDKMFEQFSKAQRVNTLKTQLNRWVEDYNAKSKMWNRSLWKSNSLPYQLNVNDFNCY